MALPTLIIHAHPHPSQSLITRELLGALTAAPDIRLHSLYERYPDFDIDVRLEQQVGQNEIDETKMPWSPYSFVFSIPNL